MKAVLIALVSLAALSTLTPVANAQQTSTTVTLVQKFQPVIHSYPGVSADILGIRPGMTVSQAEAIAEKNYPGKPWVSKVQDTYSYKGVEAQSHPFVEQVRFLKLTAHTFDILSMHFSSPVTGNSLYAITRMFRFFGEGNSGVQNAPLVSTVKASLIKKYGPPIVPPPDPRTLQFLWVFTQNSPIICNYFSCIETLMVENEDLESYQQDRMEADQQPDVGAPRPLDWTWMGRASIGLSTLDEDCGIDINHPSPSVLRIWAEIDKNHIDQTKVNNMSVTIGDPETCMEDGKGVAKQLKADAIKFYNTVSKPSAVPKL